jgi:hypothetical protein
MAAAGVRDERLGQRLGERLERLVRWWTTATKEARFALLLAASKKAPEAPQLHELFVAIYLAEAEAGEIEKG